MAEKIKFQLDKVGPVVTIQWGENTVITTEAELGARIVSLPKELAHEVRERLGLNPTIDLGMTEDHG